MSAELPEDPPFVFVAVGGRRFGLPAAAVSEILLMLEPTPMPSWPDEALGLIDVRGELMPLVDVAPRLGCSPTLITPAHLVVLVAARARRWGLVVERVDGVHPARLLTAKELGTVRADDMPEVCMGLTRDGKGPILILDPERLVAGLRLETPPHQH